MQLPARHDDTPATCKVPGCKSVKHQYDCCRKHCGQAIGAARSRYLDNEGIIDPRAIINAVVGEYEFTRPRMTWVETLIAAAILRSRGATRSEIENLTGFPANFNKNQMRAMDEIAAAMPADYLENWDYD